jgi:hypothetical protein
MVSCVNAYDYILYTYFKDGEYDKWYLEQGSLDKFYRW